MSPPGDADRVGDSQERLQSHDKTQSRRRVVVGGGRTSGGHAVAWYRIGAGHPCGPLNCSRGRCRLVDAVQPDHPYDTNGLVEMVETVAKSPRCG
ncbi:MAG: hypothetical protein K6U14_10850 [Firmicutes bacterium]|nr:hypothetical protein [Alicyclobacillaceae bacterium]MCL6498110.1 hypothetical protein [Bacillota bacterium]